MCIDEQKEMKKINNFIGIRDIEVNSYKIINKN